ncbi:MAG: folate-binding protein YgfZ [Cryptosporangiaceae bacterium]|jgi:folate-binding protein YgfZ|nr:folate-binding protein YgfZ [Cryptosporangiaceae bacterium]
MINANEGVPPAGVDTRYMTTALLDSPGAVAADGHDAGVAAHYGDPFREQRTLAESVGLVDRSHRGVLAVPGADRLSWLHSLTTQHLSDLRPNQGAETLVLSPHGHVEHHVLVAEDGETTWLDVEPGTQDDLLAFLTRMRFLLRVEPAEVTADWAVLSLVGPDTPQALAGLGAEVPPASYDVRPLPGGGWVRRMPWPGVDAADLLVPRAEVAGVVARSGAPLCGSWAYEALRVEGRHPRLRFETDHRTIVQEPGWIPSAVHLSKGCYRGQETVARVQNLGRPPRRLVLVHLDGSSEHLPPTGAPITVDGREIGFVTTAVRHHELGQIALALVKRSVPDDASLAVGEVLARIDADL